MKSFITGKCSFLRDGANLAIAEQRWRHHIALMVNLSLASPTNMVNVNKKRVGGEFESTCKDELGQILHIYEREGVQQSWNDFIRWSAGVETINPKSFGALPKKQIDCVKIGRFSLQAACGMHPLCQMVLCCNRNPLHECLQECFVCKYQSKVGGIINLLSPFLSYQCSCPVQELLL